MQAHEIRADHWERGPQQLAEEFQAWFEWIKSKECGSERGGYRLNVSRSEATNRLPELRGFSDAIREFMAGRTEPPIFSIELFAGYINDLRRASEFNESIPAQYSMYSKEEPEDLNQRLPESKLPEIRTANSIIRKWASRATGKENEQLPKKQTKNKNNKAQREEEICQKVYDSFSEHPTRDTFQQKCCDELRKDRGQGIGTDKATEMWNRFLNKRQSSSAPSPSSAPSGVEG